MGAPVDPKPMSRNAALAYAIGLPLSLGALVFVPAGASIVLIVRTALEDRLLRSRLPGYPDYARKTRYRLAPGVW